MRLGNIFRLTGILAIIGLGLAIYLLYEFFTPPHQTLCYVNSLINCEASTKGLLSKTLGVPTALYGLTGYFLILIASIKKWPRLLFGVVTFGLLFCLRITILEIFVVKALCPVCLACQLDMIFVFVLSLLSLQKKSGKL